MRGAGEARIALSQLPAKGPAHDRNLARAGRRLRCAPWLTFFVFRFLWLLRPFAEHRSPAPAPVPRPNRGSRCRSPGCYSKGSSTTPLPHRRRGGKPLLRRQAHTPARPAIRRPGGPRRVRRADGHLSRGGGAAGWKPAPLRVVGPWSSSSPKVRGVSAANPKYAPASPHVVLASVLWAATERRDHHLERHAWMTEDLKSSVVEDAL